MEAKYSFKNLDAYKEAKNLVKVVYGLIEKFPKVETYALCDQLRRAVISIPSNIAEGVSRISNKEKIHFLEIAYASMMEVDSQLDVSIELGYITTDQYKIIENLIVEISKQLSSLRTKYQEK